MQESFIYHSDNARVVGLDEVGRGPLAGPVIAAAVILNPEVNISGLADSKKISSSKRQSLAQEIKNNASAWGIGRAECHEIDEINILQASLLAMQRAFYNMTCGADHALVDGTHCPQLPCTVEAIIKGDQKVPAISAASIIAKVERDTEMIVMEEHYPGYGFAKHKGYPTREHLVALEKLGVSTIHRRTFAPVKRILQDASI